MNIIESIQQKARDNNWPYPKTFEAYKTAGITSYTVRLGENFQSHYVGNGENFEHNELQNYKPLKVSNQFSSNGVKEAIMDHTHAKTNYNEFLEEIAKAGVSHYQVNMLTREIRYFNPDETLYHQEIVPKYENRE